MFGCDKPKPVVERQESPQEIARAKRKAEQALFEESAKSQSDEILAKQPARLEELLKAHVADQAGYSFSCRPAKDDRIRFEGIGYAVRHGRSGAGCDLCGSGL